MGTLSVSVIFGKETRASNQPIYTDAQIVASIKKNLENRLSRKSTTKQPTTTQSDFDLFSSTDLDWTDIDFVSTEVRAFEDNDEYNTADEAEIAFTDDFPAMSETMKNLNKALDSLNNQKYEYNANHNEYIKRIKNKIKTLLRDYNEVEYKTYDLISIIREITNEENKRRLFMFLQPQSTEKQDVPSKNVLFSQFGDDIYAIQQTMKRLVESMNALNQFDDKTRLHDKFLDLLNSYIAIVEDTNELISLIEELYKYTN